MFKLSIALFLLLALPLPASAAPIGDVDSGIVGDSGSGSVVDEVDGSDSGGSGNNDPSIGAPPATPPDTSIILGPDLVTASTAARLVFTSDTPGATFECRLDEREPETCSSPVDYADLPNGQHSFSVGSIDRAGNSDKQPATWTWTVDTTPPDTTITAGPAGMVSGPSMSFAFESTKPGATFTCSLDGAAFAPCVSPTVLAKLGGGIHRWRVAAVSPAGVVDPTPATRVWIVDASGPEVTIRSGPTQGMRTAATSAVFTFAASERGATFQCALDGAMPASCSTRERRSGLTSGPHTFTVFAVDRFGNAGPPATRRWTIVARGR
ncbi:MAG: putative internalin [Thermoleophilia bacterium]|nr:putative internalin [Thermoleophilia bacterium]MCZ4497182.1 putative internalin [Thermoleophilia bacterium]